MDDMLLDRCLTSADLEIRGDGRTVYGLAVPFDAPTTVNDGGGEYTEVFRQGAFVKTIAEGAQTRVKFFTNHSHRQNKLPIGVAQSLREDQAGLVGEFRVSKTPDGDQAIELVRDGALDSFSIGFAPVKQKGDPVRGGLVERLEVKLREVSLVAFPAYAGATVSGVRSQFSEDEWSVLAQLARNLGTPEQAADLVTAALRAADQTTEPLEGGTRVRDLIRKARAYDDRLRAVRTV